MLYLQSFGHYAHHSAAQKNTHLQRLTRKNGLHRYTTAGKGKNNWHKSLSTKQKLMLCEPFGPERSVSGW